MFRLTTLRRVVSAFTLSTLAAASAAAAQGVETSTERYYDKETGNYVMSRAVTGADGGTMTYDRTCGGHDTYDSVSGCVSSKTVTGQDGQTASRERATIKGPIRTRSVGRTTGPEGNSVTRFRRFRN